MAEKETILTRIKKLLNLTVERGATPDEAAVAAAKVQQLLLEHNLDLSEVESVNLEKDDVEREDVQHGAYHRPFQSLLYVLAKYNFCSTVNISSGYRGRGGYQSALFGKKHNIEVVRYLFDHLSRALITEAERQHRSNPHTGDLRSFKSAFIIGAASAISERLRDQRRQQESDVKCTALVVKQDALVKAKVAEHFPSLRKSRPNSIRNHSGYAAGAAYGRTVPLNSGIGSRRTTGVLS